MVHRARLIPLAVFLVLAACTERAGSPRSAKARSGSRPTADADFEQGDRLFREARYDQAIAAFEKARSQYEAGGDREKVLSCQVRIGESLSEKGNYDDALSLLTTALQEARVHLLEENLAAAEAQQALGHVSWRKGRYEDALVHLKKALSARIDLLGEQNSEVARTYHHLGEVYQRQGDVEQARRFHELALDIRTSVLGEKDAAVAETANSLAGDYWMRGEYDKALELVQRAAAIWRAALGEKHPKTAKAYGNIGILYAMKGDYDPSIEFAEKQLEIQLATVGEKHPSVANVHQNLGLTYRYKGDYEKALGELEKAIAGFSAALGPTHPEVANAYNNLGDVLNRKGDHGQAAAYHEKALSILVARFGEKHPLVADARYGLGETLRRQGRYGAASSSYQKALAIRRSLFGEHHPGVAQCWNGLALAAAERGDDEGALRDLQQAIRANIPTLTDSDPYANPPLNNMLSEEELLVSLEEKGKVLAERFEKKKDRRDLEAAVQSYRQASRLLDKMRSGYKAEGSKLFLSERATGIYDDAIRTARRLLEIAPGPDTREAVFLFAEKSRGGILLEALSDAEAKQFANLPAALLDEERRLRADLAFYDRTVTAEELKGAGTDRDKLSRARDRRFELERQYAALLQRLEREHPDYYNLKYQLRTASIAEVQKDLLDDETTLVEYFLGRETLVVYTLTRQDFDITAAPRDPGLERQVEDLRRAIVAKDEATYTRLAHELHRALIGPVAVPLLRRNLIVVPDGVLSAVPFEALLTQPVEAARSTRDYSKLPYLVKRHAVSYAYSATLLLQTLKRERPATDRDFLAFAPVFADEGLGGPAAVSTAEKDDRGVGGLRGPLPASRAEVTQIATLFRRRESLWSRLLGGKTRVLLDEEAGEDELKATGVGEFRYLHFATHGLADDIHPKLSGLRLAHAGGSPEDGILHLGEIYNLNLNADLVVLSACDTGRGRIARGEGIIGLARGFLFAGAGNLLVSLWPVGDAPTTEVMVSFYGRMLDGRTKAQALREAKLDLMERNPELAKPYYWSAFTLIGR